MDQLDYQLKPDKEFIQLNQLLKTLNLVGTGGEAKIRIQDGEATFNGEVETQVRKKLRRGDQITFSGKAVNIV